MQVVTQIIFIYEPVKELILVKNM